MSSFWCVTPLTKYPVYSILVTLPPASLTASPVFHSLLGSVGHWVPPQPTKKGEKETRKKKSLSGVLTINSLSFFRVTATSARVCIYVCAFVCVCVCVRVFVFVRAFGCAHACAHRVDCGASVTGWSRKLRFPCNVCSPCNMCSPCPPVASIRFTRNVCSPCNMCSPFAQLPSVLWYGCNPNPKP